MKFSQLRMLALILSVLVMMLTLVACNGDDNGNDTTTPDESQEEVAIKVSIKVKELNGNVAYDAPEFTYYGEAPTPIELIVDYFYMEHDGEEVEFDEFDDIVSIGTVEAGDVIETGGSGETTSSYKTYWWWTLNGRDATVAIDEYVVKDGDSIEFYLKRVSDEAYE